MAVAMGVEPDIGGHWLEGRRLESGIHKVSRQALSNLEMFTVTYCRDSHRVQGAVGQRISSCLEAVWMCPAMLLPHDLAFVGALSLVSGCSPPFTSPHMASRELKASPSGKGSSLNAVISTNVPLI